MRKWKMPYLIFKFIGKHMPHIKMKKTSSDQKVSSIKIPDFVYQKGEDFVPIERNLHDELPSSFTVDVVTGRISSYIDAWNRLDADRRYPIYGFCNNCRVVVHAIPYHQGDTIHGKEIKMDRDGIRVTCPRCLGEVIL